MNTREKLDNRRRLETFDFKHGINYTCSVGFFDDGRVAELFLNSAKIDSDVDMISRDAAITASLALQYHAPIETLLHSLARNPNGTYASPLGHALNLIIKRGKENG